MQEHHRFIIFKNYYQDDKLPYFNYLILKIVEQAVITFATKNSEIKKDDYILDRPESNTLKEFLLFLNAQRYEVPEKLYSDASNYIVLPPEMHQERHRALFNFLQQFLLKLNPELQRLQIPPDFILSNIDRDLAMIFIDDLFRIYLTNRIIEKFIAQNRSAWWELPFGDAKLDAKAKVILRLIKAIIEYRENEYKKHRNYEQYYKFICGFADLATENNAEIEETQSSYLQKALKYFSLFREKISPKNRPTQSKLALALQETRKKIDEVYQKEFGFIISNAQPI